MAHTQQVTKEFGRLLVDDEFVRIEGRWNQQSNADNLFVASGTGFEAWRKNAKSGFFIFPSKAADYSVFSVGLTFTFSTTGSKSTSAGIVLQAQEDGTGALIVEINRKKQFRVRRAVANRLVSISGEGEGWKKGKNINPKGLNTVQIRTYDKIYDLYINDKFMYSFAEVEYGHGALGLYIGAGSKVTFNRLQVHTDDDHANNESTTAPIDQEKALSAAIVKLKETINKKDKRITELETQVRQISASRAVDTTILREKEEAESKLVRMMAELETIKAENAALKDKVTKLEDFRNKIKESENGDILINLTTLNARQKEQIEQLQATNKALMASIEQQKADKADLARQIQDKQNETDGLRNEKINLMSRLFEKDSMLNTQQAQLELLDQALANCHNSMPRKSRQEKSADRKQRRKEKKKEEPVLFDE
ncbi:MAG: hypothetical protein JNL57_05250 [Bacteroidetes bacterium]|nr:hypothetical protein [Bacteroidota bacterium]